MASDEPKLQQASDEVSLEDCSPSKLESKSCPEIQQEQDPTAVHSDGSRREQVPSIELRQNTSSQLHTLSATAELLRQELLSPTTRDPLQTYNTDPGQSLITSVPKLDFSSCGTINTAIKEQSHGEVASNPSDSSIQAGVPETTSRATLHFEMAIHAEEMQSKKASNTKDAAVYCIAAYVGIPKASVNVIELPEQRTGVPLRLSIVVSPDMKEAAMAKLQALRESVDKGQLQFGSASVVSMTEPRNEESVIHNISPRTASFNAPTVAPSASPSPMTCSAPVSTSSKHPTQFSAPSEDSIARMSAAIVKVAESTIRTRALQDTALATFLDGTPFHEFGQWLIDQCRCVFRVQTEKEMSAGLSSGQLSASASSCLSTPRMVSLSSRTSRILPFGVLPKLDLAELHRACRTYLTKCHHSNHIQPQEQVRLDTERRQLGHAEELETYRAHLKNLFFPYRELEVSPSLNAFTSQRNPVQEANTNNSQESALYGTSGRDLSAVTCIPEPHSACNVDDRASTYVASAMHAKQPPHNEASGATRVGSSCIMSRDFCSPKASADSGTNNETTASCHGKHDDIHITEQDKRKAHLREVESALQQEIALLEVLKDQQWAPAQKALNHPQQHQTPQSLMRMMQLKARLQDGHRTEAIHCYLDAVRAGTGVPQQDPGLQSSQDAHSSSHTCRDHLYVPTVVPMSLLQQPCLLEHETSHVVRVEEGAAGDSQSGGAPTLSWVGKVPSSWEGHFANFTESNDSMRYPVMQAVSPLDRYRAALGRAPNSSLQHCSESAASYDCSISD